MEYYDLQSLNVLGTLESCVYGPDGEGQESFKWGEGELEPQLCGLDELMEGVCLQSKQAKAEKTHTPHFSFYCRENYTHETQRHNANCERHEEKTE